MLTAIVAALVAVSPPVDALADHSLTAHMTQHVVLLDVVAVLLGLALPLRWHPSAFAVAVTAVVTTVVLWAWHAPVFYEAAVHHGPLHGVEHLTLLASATALWYAAFRSPRAGVLALFGALIPSTILGALMTVSRATWYSSYPKLADQQMAGVVMWGFGGGVTIAVAVALFARMLSRSSLVS